MSGVKGRSGRKKKHASLLPAIKKATGFWLLNERKDKEFRVVFDRLFSRCKDIIGDADETSFNGLVNTACLWMEAMRDLEKSGKYEFNTKTGTSGLTAACKAERMYYRDMMSHCREFGLTPSSRATLISLIKGDEPPPEKSADSFISSNPGDPEE